MLLAAFLGCDDGPSGLSTGSLEISVSGLPQGKAAAIEVTGPQGFERDIAHDQTLLALLPGTYTLTATQVTFGNAGYAPIPEVQTIVVSSGQAPATAAIEYAPAIGSLTLTVDGLPGGANAHVEVTRPGFSRTFTASTTLTDLVPGAYSINAASITVDNTLYNPSPITQGVEVPAAEPASATASVSYAASSTGVFNLSIDGMYVVQSTQTYAGTVPLVRNRDGLLRVFVVANQLNAVRPAVRVRLFQNGTLLSTHTIEASGFMVPTSVDESDLTQSWNLVIPGSLLQPGLSILADVDPDGTVVEGNEADNMFPTSQSALAMTVRSVPTLRVRFVPVQQSANGLRGSVTSVNRNDFLAVALRMHPLTTYQTDIDQVYTTSVPALEPKDGNGAWGRILSEINARRTADPDGSNWYYYGVVKAAYASGIAGLGYVPGNAAVGWDYLPSGATVAAHELAHNWGRRHAPCGDASRPDVNYPYPQGGVGVFGFDFLTGSVKSNRLTDLMGYCRDQWISDYTYVNVMNYREANSAPLASAAPVPSLLVWGRIAGGQLVLEPAFQILAPPQLPDRPGRYSVEGLAADGSTIFSLSFEPQEVADAPSGDGHFAFAVPLSAARAAQLASVRLSGGGRVTLMTAPGPGRPRFRLGAGTGEAAVRRVTADRVAVHWDVSAHPVVMVRDPVTGRILSFARGGDAEVVTDRDEVELVASDRVRSQSIRAKVAAR